MDTTAYLTRQGWLGDGHALHPSGHGIKRPLLVSKKTSALGVGKKAHDVYADQWWSRAFDETLKSLNSGNTPAKTTETGEAKPFQTSIYTAKWTRNGGLYGSFVRGEGLKGTMKGERPAKHSGSEAGRARKRRRLDDPAESRKERDKKPSKKVSGQHKSNLRSLEKLGKSDASPSNAANVEELAFQSQNVQEPRPSHQGAVRKKKSRVVAESITPDSYAAKPGTDPNSVDAENIYSGAEGNAAPLEADVRELETAPTGDYASQRHYEKEKRKSVKRVLEIGVGNDGEYLEVESNPRIKQKKKRQKDKHHGK